MKNTIIGKSYKLDYLEIPHVKGLQLDLWFFHTLHLFPHIPSRLRKPIQHESEKFFPCAWIAVWICENVHHSIFILDSKMRMRHCFEILKIRLLRPLKGAPIHYWATNKHAASCITDSRYKLRMGLFNSMQRSHCRTQWHDGGFW